MKILLDSETLAKKIKILSKVTGTSTLPILNNLLFEVMDNVLKITASDSENLLETFMPLDESDGVGKFCIDCKTMVSALSNISQQPITISVNENKVCLNYQNGEFNFSSFDAAEYPSFAAMENNDVKAGIPAKMVVDSITRCLPFVATEGLRPSMCCIYFDMTENMACVVSSDGSTLIKNALEIECNEPCNFLVPTKPANLLRQVLGGSDEMVTIRKDEKYTKFTSLEWNLTCRIVDMRYPNYNAVIPTTYTKKAIIDKSSFVNAIKRVMTMANTQSYLVKLNFTDNKVELSTENVDFYTSAIEVCDCDYNDNPLKIGIKSTCVLEILSHIPGDTVNIELEDERRPILFSPSEEIENQKILAMQMPMLLID